MKFPPETRIERVVSTDISQPVIRHAYLRIEEVRSRVPHKKTVVERKGWLEATNSYILVRIPVTVADEDTEGFVPIDAIKAARSAKTYEVACTADTVVVAVAGGTLSLSRPTVGTWPKLEEIVAKDNGPVAVAVGLNASLLADLAAGLGADNKIFRAVRMDISEPLKPIAVFVGSGDRSGAHGILMPVRVATG